MCGIFGIVFRDAAKVADQRLVNRSCDLLGHRGPDGVGSFIEPGLALAHTRLALVDLDPRSNQPFWDESGRYCLVYNGEIYNFKELRTRLEQCGVRFRTTSDTEVLLQCLITYGKSALEQLEGMFAFAFYDRLQRSLLLARDRFGIKPLFCYIGTDCFMFASEVKAFQPWVALKPDLLSVSSYLQGFPGPTVRQTFFENVFAVESGTYQVVVGAEPAEKSDFWGTARFWDPDLNRELSLASPTTLVDRLERLLVDSVERHLLSDAPVGALCSGGLDSSVIMAMAAKAHPDLAIFHADVLGPQSEYQAAKELARHLKLELCAVAVRDEDFIEQTAWVTYHYGQPFIYHPNSVPFAMVARLVRQNRVKAVLTGEGADECFLGYAHLPTENFFAGYRRTVQAIRDQVYRIPLLGRHLCAEPLAHGPWVRDLHSRFEAELDVEDLPDIPDANDRKTYTYLGYHLRTLLHRNDTLGMAAGIEARFPFLSSDLVHFAVNLPYRYKIRPSLRAVREVRHPFLSSKWILRQVADRYLPAHLSQRPKRGFPTSAFERMRIAGRYFSDSFVQDLFGLGEPGLRRLVSGAKQEMMNRLLHLDVWGRVCLRSEDPADVTRLLQRHLSFSKKVA